MRTPLEKTRSQQQLLPLLLLLFYFFFSSWTYSAVDAKPTYNSRIRGQNVDSASMSKAVDFLTKFGYLPQTDLDAGNLRTEEQLQDSIRSMQRFGGLPETGVIDDATVDLMRRPRCGLPDFVGTSERVRRYALQGSKWDKIDLTWSIHIVPAGLSYHMVRDQLSRAFRVWSEASRLVFRELSRGSTSADIVVSFYNGTHQDGYAFDGPGSILAHAFFPGGGLGGDTHFDGEEEWDASQKSNTDGVSLFAVAAHEFGHSLGLSHSRDQSALMYPYYHWIGYEYTLSDDDRMGIQQLYGPKYEVSWATLPNYFTRPPATRPPPKQEPTTRPRPDRPPPDRPRPTVPAPTDIVPGKPSTCDTTYDAISVIRGEVFIFKEKYFWRLNDRGLMQNYPVEINRFWYELPSDIKRIDAAYERPKDKKIVFFVGNKYWMYDANHPVPGYPRHLKDLGLPEDLKKIDAAMVWGHNGKTYFFSGNVYWRYDEIDGRVELDYPRNMNMWHGVPPNIDAAFQWTDGRTYFFKGKKFWKFNDQKMKVENKSPFASAPFWMHCPGSSKQPEVNGTWAIPHLGDNEEDSDVSSARHVHQISWLCIALTLFLKVL